MKSRNRVLFVNETSCAASGYGTYGKELIPRLVKANKFDFAEFSISTTIHDPRTGHVNWRCYPNGVDKEDKRYGLYKSHSLNEHGQWRFDRVLLDFKPTHVFSIRDPWVDGFIHDSPLRPYFHYIQMPTVDSAPQRPEWIDKFIQADGVCSYTDWGLNVLREESNGAINTLTSCPAGVELDIFKPVKDKAAHRRSVGMMTDVFIIGTVMRNQVRKLYPELFRSFRMFLDKCIADGNKELAAKTYLYVHTSYPDNGWEIPELLLEHGIGHKVLFTYICNETKKSFISFFQDAKTANPANGHLSGLMPNVSNGIERAELASIYNLFDVYVQYANCEGQGMSQPEAAACGIPVMSVDYSGMADVVRKVNGYPIKVANMSKEVQLGVYRAIPDNNHLVELLTKYFTMPESMRKRKEAQARKGAEQHYDWDKIADRWINIFESSTLTGLQGQWNSPYNFKEPLTQVPNNLSNYEFVRWCSNNIINNPSYVHTYNGLKMVQDLNRGILIYMNQPEPFGKQEALKWFGDVAEKKKGCEQARVGMVRLQNEDYIKYAHMKEKK